jgi:uncharacterized protein DUF4157
VYEDREKARPNRDNSRRRATTHPDRGQELDAATRGRLERSFGEKLPAIKVLPDATEAVVPASARAMALGNQIAFGRGEYRPGTLAGDILIAHEVAHSLEQRGPGPPVAGQVAEQQANQVAPRAALGLPAAGVLRNRGGLALRRCEKGPSTTQGTGGHAPTVTPADAGPVVNPREKLAKLIEAQAATGHAGPQDWANLRQAIQNLKLDRFDVSGALGDADFISRDANVIVELAVSDKPFWRALAGHYASDISPAPDRTLKPNPLVALTTDVIAGGSVSADGADALRDIGFIFGWDQLNDALTRQGVPPAAVTTLIVAMRQNPGDFKATVDSPDLFPISVVAPAKGAKLSDPRVRLVGVFLHRGKWSSSERTGLRVLVQFETWSNARALLVAAGLDSESAATVATAFTASDVDFKHWTEQERLIWSFEQSGGVWHLSAETKAQLALPVHPPLPAPLGPYAGPLARSRLGSIMDIGEYKFSSGLKVDAKSLVLTLAGHTFTIIATETRLTSDDTLLDRLEDALGTVPAAHLNLINTLVFDPGNDPFAAANANAEGKVNIYLSGAPATLPTANLRELVTHEVGHLVSFQAAASIPDFWAQWDAAISADKADPSRYALTNHLEDFAETYVLYMASKGRDPASRGRFAHRLGILDRLWPK